MSTPDFDIGATLRKRLAEINHKKELLSQRTVMATDQLKNLFSKSKPIRYTTAQLDAKIEELECTRTSTSLPLAEEKRILREIDQIKKSKIQVEENKGHELLIQEKKGDIENLRNDLRSMIAQIAELESAIAKIDLADRLGCSTNDLQTRAVECPVEKLGQVIGKGGSNIKNLEKSTGCIIDVDKVKGVVHLRGNNEAIIKGVDKIEKITHSVEDSVTLTKPVHTYFFGNRMVAFKKLQKDNPDVFFDLDKKSQVLKIRGKVGAISAAKDDLAAIDVVMESFKLVGREVGIVVGKAGATVIALVEKYNVGIDVDRINDESSNCRIVGFSTDVAGAKTEIGEMLFKNEDVETSIIVSSLAKNKFLEGQGNLIKKLQKEVNEALDCNSVRLQFEAKDKDDVNSSCALLGIRSPRMHHLAAVDLTKKNVAEFEAKTLIIKIEQHLIPKLIGKEGATINGLKKMGKGSTIDIDRTLGEVSVLTNDEETKELVKTAIEDIIAANQVLQIPVESNMMMLLFGAPGKGMRSKLQQNDVHFKQDGMDTVSFRGSIEKITECAAIVRDFISSNYTVEVPYERSEGSLLGRRDSILRTLEKTGDVRVFQAKQRAIVEIRGIEEKAKAAAEEVKRFLYGGDGLVVEKMSIPSTVIGAIIGKSGSNIAKLEKEYPDVNIDVSSMSSLATLRGPEEQIKLCAGAILQDVVNIAANDNVTITPEVHTFLSKTSNIRKVTNDLPVNITLSSSSVRLRGNCFDVAFVKANLLEVLSGDYEGSISLMPSLFSNVSTSPQVGTFTENIQNRTSTSIIFDTETQSLKVKGKKSNVRFAKNLFIEGLEKEFPQFITVRKTPKHLSKVVSKAKTYIGIAAKTGCMILFDHDTRSFLLQSSSTDSISEGLDAINEHAKECEKLVKIIDVDSSESWLLFNLINNREPLKEIEETSNTKIDIIIDESIISITGEGSESAKEQIETTMTQMRKENAFLDIPESSMTQFIGNSSRHINGLAGTYGINIDRVKKYPTRIRLHGSESGVRSAVEAVYSWVKKWEEKNQGITVELDEETLLCLMDNKPTGSKRKIQRKCGVKLDVCVSESNLTIRGGKNSSPDLALQELDSLSKSLFKEAAKVVEAPKVEPVTIQIPTPVPAQNPAPSAIPAPTPIQPVTQIAEKEIQVLAPTLKVATNVQVPEKDSIPTTVVGKAKSQEPKKKMQSVNKLFSFLVSDDAAADSNGDNQEHWDSSTVSSGVENVESGYFRSASGYTVRL